LAFGGGGRDFILNLAQEENAVCFGLRRNKAAALEQDYAH
jgi:hypothetical protein